MLPAKRITKGRPELLILPARVGHDPVEVIEHAADEMRAIVLRSSQPGIDGQAVAADEVRDDRVAVPERFAIIDDVRQLLSRCMRCVKGMPMNERHAGQLEERKHLEAVAVIVGDPEEPGIGVKGQQRPCS